MLKIKQRNQLLHKSFTFARTGNVTMAQACYDMAKRLCKVTGRQEAALQMLTGGKLHTGKGFDVSYSGVQVY